MKCRLTFGARNDRLEYPEGATPLDPDEMGGLKFKHITTRGELDQLEQANIESGLRWLTRQRADVLTDEFAMTLHKRLFNDVWDCLVAPLLRASAAFR
jgi:fido (protein-threonine AMPylation protein)